MKNGNTAGKQKKAIVAVCLCLLVLPGVFALYRFAAGKAEKNRITGELAADKAAAQKIFQQSGKKPAGMINGEPFFQEDLDVYIAEFRAIVTMHYARKYSLGGTGPSFWDTKYGGRTPRQHITELAVNDLAKTMVVIQEARKRDIDTPQTYHDLEEERVEWNRPTGEIVYGPKAFAAAEYNRYRIKEITDELKTELLKSELAPTVTQLRAAFNSLDQGYKVAPWHVYLTRFSWDEGLPDGEIRTAITHSLSGGLSPEEIVSALGTYPGFSCEDLEIDSVFVSKGEEYEQERAAVIEKADTGTCFFVREEIPELYYLTKREGGGFYTFEQAPGLGRNKWINDQFEIFLDKKIKAARITLFTDADFH
jgi:hypothetical protein